MTDASTLTEATRFLIDFNVHAVAAALGLPIPDEAAALMYGVSGAAIAAYQAEIDADLAAAAGELQAHPGVRALVSLVGDRGPLLCIGDSITTCRYSYAHLLRHVLTPHGVTVHNRGYSGHTTTHALELTFTQWLALAPAVVIIKYGVNDSKQFDGSAARPLVSPDEYTENLRRVITAFQRYTGAQVVVLTPTPVVETVVNVNPDLTAMRLTWDNAVIRRYGDHALAAAAGCGVRSVDLRSTLGDPPDAALYYPDGLHPNALGQRRLLRYLLDAVG